MKAKTTTGQIIELPKECGCMDSIHTGPHWLHMDDYDKAENKSNLEAARQSGNVALFNHACQAEQRRLQAKLATMERLGIVEIIRD